MVRSLVVAALTAVAASCAPGGGPPSTPSPSTPSPPAGGALVVSPGPGWSPSGGLEGPVPAPGSCHVVGPPSLARPDPACTPGAVDADVTQADLATTVCRRGGDTDSVRPPEAMTESFKYVALRAYGERAPVSAYELDHLVPLELGGASDTRNLWPELDDHPAPGVANSKDLVEDRLHDLVCAAAKGGPGLPLASAQALVAADWTTALQRAEALLVAKT